MSRFSILYYAKLGDVWDAIRRFATIADALKESERKPVLRAMLMHVFESVYDLGDELIASRVHDIVRVLVTEFAHRSAVEDEEPNTLVSAVCNLLSVLCVSAFWAQRDDDKDRYDKLIITMNSLISTTGLPDSWYTVFDKLLTFQMSEWQS